MKAIEFETKLSNNIIQIPLEIQPELRASDEKNIRVMIFLQDSEDSDDFAFKQATTAQFLNGYADSDSIYDNY